MVMIIYSILMCYDMFIISCVRCHFLVALINIGGVYTCCWVVSSALNPPGDVHIMWHIWMRSFYIIWNQS